MNWIVFAVLAGLIIAFFIIRYLSALRVRKHIGGLKQQQALQFLEEAAMAEKEARRLEAELHIVKSIYRNKNIRRQLVQHEQVSSNP